MNSLWPAHGSSSFPTISFSLSSSVSNDVDDDDNNNDDDDDNVVVVDDKIILREFGMVVVAVAVAVVVVVVGLLKVEVITAVAVAVRCGIIKAKTPPQGEKKNTSRRITPK